MVKIKKRFFEKCVMTENDDYHRVIHCAREGMKILEMLVLEILSCQYSRLTGKVNRTTYLLLYLFVQSCCVAWNKNIVRITPLNDS